MTLNMYEDDCTCNILMMQGQDDDDNENFDEKTDGLLCQTWHD